MVVAIVLAAGSSRRFGRDKLDLDLGGRPVWRWSVDALKRHPLVDAVGLVGPAERAIDGLLFRVEGGETRQDSARRGVEACAATVQLSDPLDCSVILHDGARPFVPTDVVTRVVEAIAPGIGAAPWVPVIDTIREVGPPARLVDREGLRAMQTPQGGRLGDVLASHHGTAAEVTDDAALLMGAGAEVQWVAGDRRNFKITTEDDYEMARRMVYSAEVRTGMGYDVHRFTTDTARPLMLGGVRFEDAPGLEGHSDADALVHAVVDALLGAGGLGDIGTHFPPSEAQWKNVDSLVFLRHAGTLLENEGWRIVNIDATVLAERPKIMGRREEICRAMASALTIDPRQISVKATTHEGLGAIGRGEGIAAMAVATVSRNPGE